MAATAVTPSGVRDGDPDALAGLCDRRGPAVLAYAGVVAGPARAVPAAAEAFGSFRAGVVATADLSSLDPEAMLISATRHAAARFAAADLPAQCTRVPELLAARADRSISLADHDWLEQHLAECWTCRAPVARFDAADRAYHEPPGTRLEPEATAAIVAAMTAAAPVRGAVEAQAIQAPAASPNGVAASAQPPAEHYDVPSLPDHQGAGVDQPTSSYEMPAEDLAAPEPPAPAGRSARRRRGPGRAASLLGAFGLTEREPVSGAEVADADAHAADIAGHAARDTGGAPEAISPAARAARRTRSKRSGRPAAATAAGETQSGGGSSLPRPRRTITAVPAQRRERRAMRPGLVLPIVLVVIAIVVALVIAGVFGGGEPASMPQSFAPRVSDEPTSAAAPSVVVVPGAESAGSDAVEKAKARARAAKRRAEQASKPDTTVTPPPAAAAPANSAPAAANAPPPPPPPPPPAAAGGAPKIDADNGATGAEQLPPAQDTSTVPDLAPPVETAAPPPPG